MGSQEWSRKTGRKYYVEEKPRLKEILEVMAAAVAKGDHGKQGAFVEMYFEHRRANFVKYFATLAKERANDEGQQYKFEMSAAKTGWWDVSMPYQACLLCGTVWVDGKSVGDAVWNETNTKEHGYSGMMVESVGLD